MSWGCKHAGPCGWAESAEFEWWCDTCERSGPLPCSAYSDGVTRYPNTVTYNVRPPCVTCGQPFTDHR